MERTIQLRLIIGFITILASVNSKANISAKININAMANVYTHHHGIKSGGIKCGYGSNGTYVNGTYEHAKNINTTIVNSTQVANISSNMAGRASALYSIDFTTKYKNSNNIEYFKLSVSQLTRKYKEYFWKSGCDHNHMTESLKNTDIHGTIDINYNVPVGVWAVKLQEVSNSNLFKESQREFVNSSFNTKDLKNKSLIVWTQPNTVLKRRLNILNSNDDNSSFDNKVKDEYEIQIEPVGIVLNEIESLSFFDSYFSDLERLNKSIINVNQNDINEYHDSLRALAVNSFTVLRNLDKFNIYLKSIKSSHLHELNENLFNLTMFEYPEVSFRDANLVQNLKSVLAIVSYEVANHFVEDLESYCTVQSVYLEGLDKIIKVPGLKYALFLLDRMKSRIDSNIINMHRTFLKRIKSVSTSSSDYMKYSDIYTIKELPIQLSSVFNAVRRVAQPQKRPYAESYQELTEFYNLFKDIDGHDSTLQSLRFLADIELRYVKALFAHVRKYSPDNHEKIDVSNLEQTLDELSLQKDKTVKLLHQSMNRLLNDTKSNSPALTEILSKLRSHNLNLIKTSYKDVEWDFNFENIRTTFVSNDRVKKNLSTINQCIFDEGK